MSLKPESTVCTISKGIALFHENYGVSIKKFSHWPSVLFIYMWKRTEGRCETEDRVVLNGLQFNLTPIKF